MLGCKTPLYGVDKKHRPYGDFIYYPRRQVALLPDIMRACQNNITTLIRYVNWLGKQSDLRLLLVPYYIIPGQLAIVRNPQVYYYLKTSAEKLAAILQANKVRLVFGRYPLLTSDNPNVVTTALREIELLTDFLSWLAPDKSVRLIININRAKFNNISRLSDKAKQLLAICNNEYTDLAEIAEYWRYLPIIPDIFSWWVRSGKYIRANDPAWVFIKKSWQKVWQKPIIIAGIGTWSAAVWSLPMIIRANYIRRLAPRPIDFEYVPIDYIEWPNRRILLKRCSLEGISRRGEGMWHIGLLDEALEYLAWADVIFDVLSNNLAMPQIVTRLSELREEVA